VSAEFHQFDKGTKLRATVVDQDSVVVNLASSTVKQYIIRKPSGTEVTLDLSFVTDGSDGKVEYVTTSSTLDEAGFYKLQGYIEIGSNNWHTDTITFRVHPNL
jgi:hypothetical protein